MSRAATGVQRGVLTMGGGGTQFTNQLGLCLAQERDVARRERGHGVALRGQGVLGPDQAKQGSQEQKGSQAAGRAAASGGGGHGVSAGGGALPPISIDDWRQEWGRGSQPRTLWRAGACCDDDSRWRAGFGGVSNTVCAIRNARAGSCGGCKPDRAPGCHRLPSGSSTSRHLIPSLPLVRCANHSHGGPSVSCSARCTYEQPTAL